ncbi:ATP-grasp domain-containing protein [Microbispora triticiradicis]|uniref:ATP-grasp domain-containing protein n=1 Tax=Microbispora triticiradicis TaxID=2200763 RepID=A0ABX9LCF5_9ACTN|nr:biotin carboxylase N-terminal domain-containing protein [Microbispora triticiradicis]RGA01318.1 ATP-grasp domain-containing protein [Microbispora triticiradicis]GLW20249.1 acetyl/propionyl-CoA carboxylase subuit alpha [Microbispora amethystogenes]
MIGRLLVANRGEIARRVFRTCRELGVETVAVFSDADADAPHVAEADQAVRLGAPLAYLDPDRVIEAARRSGADAVHPGYGFLSEHAGFARAVLDAGLTWIGPSPEAVAAMGTKIEAKALMAEAGVPVLPTIPLSPDAPPQLTFPVLVKASAGGGGRGMRVVRDQAGLAEAVASARREALSAFGDGTLFAEPLQEGARHIEVQILADEHGTVWALGERECSIQRRHQKVIEEAPSPAVTPELRRELSDAAIRAARAIGYTGAGTVEFLVSDEGFFFLEMNTRLQVEHPVTECVYGVDLVRLQIEVAEGARLAALPPSPVGHAIEARLYAEDAEGRPQSGVLHRFEIPGVDGEFGLGARLRLDSGVVSGGEVGVHYDPMLAKVVSYGGDRAEAARRLAHALARARIHGLTTNRDILVGVLRHPDFLSGALDTGFLDRRPVPASLAGPGAVRLSALAAALAGAAANRAEARRDGVLGGLPSGWRNVPSQPRRTAYDTEDGGRLEITYRLSRDGLRAEGFEDVALVSADPGRVVLETGGLRHAFEVAVYPGVVHVDSSLGPVRLTPVERLPEPAARVSPGALPAPMPGTVLRVEVKPGDVVEAGQPVVVLEAMKMEHLIVAPASGTVAALHVVPGARVEAGVPLADIEPAPETKPDVSPETRPDVEAREGAPAEARNEDHNSAGVEPWDAFADTTGAPAPGQTPVAATDPAGGLAAGRDGTGENAQTDTWGDLPPDAGGPEPGTGTGTAPSGAAPVADPSANSGTAPSGAALSGTVPGVDPGTAAGGGAVVAPGPDSGSDPGVAPRGEAEQR